MPLASASRSLSAGRSAISSSVALPIAYGVTAANRHYVVIDNSQSLPGVGLREIFRKPGDAHRDPIGLDLYVDGEYYYVDELRQVSLYPGTITWMGRTPEFGSVVITQTEHVVNAAISVGPVEYSVTQWKFGAPVWAVVEDGPDEPTTAQRLPNAPIEYNLGSGGPPLENGPFDSQDAVIDVLAVYDPSHSRFLALATEEQMEAAVLTGITTTNNAMQRSGVNTTVRYLGIQAIDWDTNIGSNPNDCDTCDARRELETQDGIADWVFSHRDIEGADIVLGLMPVLSPNGLLTSCGTGCGPHLPEPSATTSGDGYITVLSTARNLQNSVRHELGHAMGLSHDRGLDCSTGVRPYACGYYWPNENEVSDPSTICPPDNNDRSPEAFRSIMSKDLTETIGGVDFTKIRRNYYADPFISRSFTCPGQAPDTTPTGTYLPEPVNQQSANTARRVRETSSTIASYRPALPQPGGAAIWFPSPGSSVGDPQAFAWSNSSPNAHYWLEVYDPDTGQEFFNAVVNNTNQQTVSFGGASSYIALRLWTDLSTTTNDVRWVWKDYRFNVTTIASCSADEVAIGGGMDSEPCGGVCSASASTVTCNLNNGGSNNTSLTAIAGPNTAQSDGSYEAAFFGNTTNGDAFCCLLLDNDANIDSILINGSSRRDTIALSSFQGDLQEYGQSMLNVEVRGYGNNDTLTGSQETSSDYSEYLRGYNGHDTINGLAGNDRLGGGYGRDTLVGGGGNDILYSGQDGVVDTLQGGFGNNTLCSNHPRDRLFGASTYDIGSWAQLYYSPVSGAQINGQSATNVLGGICGHTSYGLWGDCLFLSGTAPPSACQAMGLTQ